MQQVRSWHDNFNNYEGQTIAVSCWKLAYGITFDKKFNTKFKKKILIPVICKNLKNLK